MKSSNVAVSLASATKNTEGGGSNSLLLPLLFPLHPHPPFASLLPFPSSLLPSRWCQRPHPLRRGEAAVVRWPAVCQCWRDSYGLAVVRWQGRVSTKVMWHLGIVNGCQWWWHGVWALSMAVDGGDMVVDGGDMVVGSGCCSTMSCPCLAQMGNHRGAQGQRWRLGWRWWWWMEGMCWGNVWQPCVAKHCNYY